MVERLKSAIEKARAARDQGPAPVAPEAEVSPLPRGDGASWAALQALPLDHKRLEANRIVTLTKSDPAHVAIDILRTRLLRLVKAQGWRRIGVSSPTQGCGKSVLTSNLALSAARANDVRTLLVDLDLRRPSLAHLFGVKDKFDIERLISGETPATTYLRKLSETLAVVLNTSMIRDSAERMQSPALVDKLSEIEADLRPDLVLVDLPPLLVSDDAIAFLNHLDGLILIVAAGESKASDVRESERLIHDHVNFIGIVLNKADEETPAYYGYE